VRAQRLPLLVVRHRERHPRVVARAAVDALRCGDLTAIARPADHGSVEIAFEHAGLDWQEHVRFDERYLRPTEADALIGDATKAAVQLGWKPTVDGRALAKLMVDADTEALSHAGRPWIDTVNLPSWSGP